MRIQSLVLATLLAVTAGLADAAGATDAAAQSNTGYAYVRGAHLSPNTPSVDVYLTPFSGPRNTTLWLTSVGYGDVSPYQRIKAGLYAVSMRPAGAPASSPVALRWTLDARAGDAFTAAAIGMNKDLHGIVLRDNLAAPASGHARVRVIQAASTAPRVTVTAVDGPVLAESAVFGTTTPYRIVRDGNWRLRAVADAPPSVRATAVLDAQSGSVYTVVVLDGKSGDALVLRSLADSVGAQKAPRGAVPAGGGGTAARPNGAFGPPAWTGIVAVVSLGALGAAMLGARRRRGVLRGKARS